MRLLYKWFVLSMVLALALAACVPPPAAPAGESGGAASAPAGGEQKKFRVAIVMPSSTTDMAFSQSIFDSLKAIQAEMGGEAAMEIAFSEGMFKVPDAAAALRDYASQGFDLVIAHGSQYGTSVQELAPDFPDTAFAWGTATDTFGLPNVFAYQADAQEGGYVNGVIAAMMSKSGKIGVTGPVEAGDAKLYVDGFKAGVLATKQDAEISVTYTGSFSDVALMTEAAKTHIANGADVLTGSSQSVVGSIGAAKEAGNVLWLGTQADQSALAEANVVASQVYDWIPTLNEMIKAIQAGTKGGSSYTLKLSNSGLKIVYGKVTVPDDVKAAADAAIKGISDGSVKPL